MKPVLKKGTGFFGFGLKKREVGEWSRLDYPDMHGNNSFSEVLLRKKSLRQSQHLN